MALTRKFLKAMGIEEEQIDQIIEAHAETTDGLKADYEKEKQEKEALRLAAKERDKYKADLEALQAAGADAARVQAEFDAFKASVAGEKEAGIKAKAVRKALEDQGIVKAAGVIVKTLDLSKLAVENGEVKGLDTFIGPVVKENTWAVETTTTRGVPTVTPPSNGGTKPYTLDAIKTMTPEEINQNWDAISKALPNLKGE